MLTMRHCPVLPFSYVGGQGGWEYILCGTIQQAALFKGAALWSEALHISARQKELVQYMAKNEACAYCIEQY